MRDIRYILVSEGKDRLKNQVNPNQKLQLKKNVLWFHPSIQVISNTNSVYNKNILFTTAKPTCVIWWHTIDDQNIGIVGTNVKRFKTFFFPIKIVLADWKKCIVRIFLDWVCHYFILNLLLKVGNKIHFVSWKHSKYFAKMCQICFLFYFKTSI